MRKLINKLLSYKIVRYIIGGGSAALLDISLLRFFTDIVGIHYMISAVMAFVISLTYGYIFQKYITFQNKEKKHLHHGGLFLLYQLIGMGIYMGLLRIFVDQFQIYYLFVAAGAKLIVFVWNYLMNLYFNFKE